MLPARPSHGVRRARGYIPGMDRQEVTARLDEAEAQIRDGQVGSNPEEFVETLWAQVHQEAQEDMQEEVYARLMAFVELLGLGPVDFPGD